MSSKIFAGQSAQGHAPRATPRGAGRSSVPVRVYYVVLVPFRGVVVP